MQNLKEVVKEVLCGSDRLVETLSLITVMVIKKKFLDQVVRFFYAPHSSKKVKQIPDAIRVVGVFYEGETKYPYVLFSYNDYRHVGKVDLWEYACKVVDEKYPQGSKDYDYKKVEQEIKDLTSTLKETLPQLFTS